MKELNNVLELPDFNGITSSEDVQNIIDEVVINVKKALKRDLEERIDFVKVMWDCGADAREEVLKDLPKGEYKSVEDVITVLKIMYAPVEEVEEIKEEVKEETKCVPEENKEEEDYIDMSGKSGFKIVLPTASTILQDRDVDYRLLTIIATCCSLRDVDNTDGTFDAVWYFDKQILEQEIKPIFKVHRNTFQKKFKKLMDVGILIPQENGTWVYNYAIENKFIRFSVEKAITLILNNEIKENSYRMLCNIYATCWKGRKTLAYKYMVTSIGLKSMNNVVVKELLKPLVDNNLIKITMIWETVGSSLMSKNYYEIVK